MGDPYPRNQPQTDKYGRGTKDGPVDANEHRTEIPVARGGDYLCIVHCNGNQRLTDTASCESDHRTIIAWGYVSVCQEYVEDVGSGGSVGGVCTEVGALKVGNVEICRFSECWGME